MLDIKKAEKIISVIFYIAIVLDVCLIILSHRIINHAILSSIITLLIIGLTWVPIWFIIYLLVLKLKNQVLERDTTITCMNTEMQEFQAVISNTTELSMTDLNGILKEISVLKRYNLPYAIRYDIETFSFLILTECTMPTYTRMSIQNQLSDRVIYKIKDSDIILQKKK